MKLITSQILNKIKKTPLSSTDGKPNAKCIVKFFNPCGRGTWYAFEGEVQENGDILFFGIVDLFDKEYGYFTLSELQSIQLPFGLKIERDMYYTPQTKEEIMSK